MKAIILISSIFYILGLKVSNKIDLVKKSNPVDKIISNSINQIKPLKAIHFKDASSVEVKPDSLNSNSSYEGLLEEDK